MDSAIGSCGSACAGRRCSHTAVSLASVDFAPLVEGLREIIQRAQGADELRHDESAREVWMRVYPELSEGQPGMLGAMTSRAEAQVLRLAALYALSDLSFRSYVVSASHLRSALEVWRYCYDSARYIFGDSLGDATADTILAALKGAEDGLSKTQIRDLFAPKPLRGGHHPRTRHAGRVRQGAPRGSTADRRTPGRALDCSVITT